MKKDSFVCVIKIIYIDYGIASVVMSKRIGADGDLPGVDIKKLRNKKLTSTEFMQVSIMYLYNVHCTLCICIKTVLYSVYCIECIVYNVYCTI